MAATGTRGISVLEVGGNPEEAMYKVRGVAEPKDYGEICNFLVVTRRLEYVDVSQLVDEMWNAKIKRLEEGEDTEEGEENGLPLPVTPETLKLLQYFWWVPNSDGSRTYYLKLFQKKEVYIRVANPLTSSFKIHPGQKKPLYPKIERRYRSVVEAGKLNWVKVDKDNKPIYQNLYHWFQSKMGNGPVSHWEHLIERKLEDHPAPLATDPNVPCNFLFDPNTLIECKEEDTPNWNSWEWKIPKEMRGPVRAYIYSIFDPDNNGRQCLWLMDKGYSGKSVFQKAINQFMDGVGVGALSQASLKGNFGFSSVWGHRLLVYGDCKNRQLLRSEKFKNLVSGDLVNVEFKNQTPFKAALQCKVLINSNTPPEINIADESETSRIIFVPLNHDSDEIMKGYCKVENGEIVRTKIWGKPIRIGNKHFLKNLVDEMPKYLWKCRESYKELCPNGSDIEMGDESINILMEYCEAPDYSFFTTFMEAECVLDEKAEISQKELSGIYNDYLLDTKGRKDFMQFSDFKVFLKNKHDISPEMDERNEVIFKGIKGDDDVSGSII